MTIGHFQRVEELFLKACELPEVDRAAFLKRACADDQGLRAEVEELLAKDRRPPKFLDTPSRFGIKTMLRARPPAPPQHVGNYRVIEVLGEGGMGVVYRAEQENPRRPVALKVIRPGVISPGMIKRFVQEAQILGRLHHPGIAHIYEAGTADVGGGAQPYFAMELIVGQPLTDYARAHQLGTRERVALVASMCQAVHHAHQKGVIHRDLKPGNVLVVDSSTGRQPMILDFGVARVTDSDVQVTTLQTDIQQLVGTIPYMSPEQVAGDPHDLDVRCDVYALGVILYELLADRLPLNVRDKSIAEAARIIRDEDPTPLSAVSRVFRGDLNTIVAKAIEKDRTRRYQSAAEFSADLERYLFDEPITARRATTLYQLAKFTRRHKPLVGGVVATIIVLLAGVIVSTLLFLQSERRRNEADWSSYVSNIAAAESLLRDNDPAAAQIRLQQAPEHLRNWEWRHLFGRLDHSLMTLELDERQITGVSWSPLGDLVAVSSHNREVVLWDLRSNIVKATLRHDREVNNVAFSPDGRRIASACWDSTIRVWNVSDQHQERVIATGGIVPSAIEWCGDGDWLVGSLYDGSIRVWDIESAAVLLTLSPDVELFQTYFFRVSPTGWEVAGSSQGGVALWDLRSGKKTAAYSLVGENLSAAAFHPSDTRIALGSLEGTIRLWDPSSDKVTTFATVKEPIQFLEFAREGHELISRGPTGGIAVWNTETGQPQSVFLGFAANVKDLSLSPDGKRAATASIDSAKIWDLTAAGDLRSLQDVSSAVLDVAFSPDGTLVASSLADYPARDAGVRIWSAESGELVRVLRGHSPQHRVYEIAFSSDGRWLVSAGGDRTLRRWNVQTGAQEAILELPYEAGVVAISPDSRRVAVGLIPGPGSQVSHHVMPPHLPDTVVVVNADTWLEETRLVGDSEYAIGVAFSPDGRTLAVGCEVNGTRLWDMATMREIGMLTASAGCDYAVAFSPDGKLLACSSIDDVVRLWRVADRSLVAELKGHSADVFNVAFSPDGTRLASVGQDHMLRLWDVERFCEVVALRGHTGQVWSVAFSPDGRTIATCGYDCTVRLWEAP